MFHSLHTKLICILLLLISSLMGVAGIFLLSGVSSFYTNLFYKQVNEVFGTENAAFVQTLRQEAALEDGVIRLQAMLEANAGILGIDSHTRNYYILDANSGQILASSDESGETLAVTPNLLTARNHEVGDESRFSDDYMDVAIPISGGSQEFILYILDNRAVANDLKHQLFSIILQALLVGLLISALFSFPLAKTMVSPIEKLTEGAERVAHGEFRERIPAESHDEIGILTQTFNHMATVLQTTLQAVEQERNKLDTLFLHMTDGVVAFDRHGKVIHANPAAKALLHQDLDTLGYEELFGETQPFSEVLTLSAPNHTTAELTLGEKIVELYCATFSGQTGGGVLAVLHDITAQHHVESQRREFVANVSHELRTPLTNVRSYAETLRDAETIPPTIQNNFLDIIINETDRMTRIVQDLLTLSRLDSGRTELTLTCFSFSLAIDSVLRSLDLEARRHRHTIIPAYDANLPLIRGDRGRLEQVILNIVGNAIKYTPDGGEIQIHAGWGNHQLWMEVADNGIGIPAEDREHIFERFYRVDKARSRESGGTGLGLSIAKEIVLRHNGTIALVPHEGQGTTIRMTLPLWQEESNHEG